MEEGSRVGKRRLSRYLRCPLQVDSRRPRGAHSGRLLNGEVEFAADSAERLRAEAKLRGSNPVGRAPPWMKTTNMVAVGTMMESFAEVGGFDSLRLAQRG
jgi:hypothetical protein